MRQIFWRSMASLLLLLSFFATGQAADPAGARVSVDISGHPFTGPAGAPVTLVVFSDYL